MEDTIDVSQRIYDYAAKEIEQYCAKSGSMGEQYDCFAEIARQVSAYLIGSAIAGLSPEEQEEELSGLCGDIRSIAAFIAAQNKPKDK